MDILEVSGKGRLEGTVRAAGAKNAMTKLLVASLLSEKRSIFRNVPHIGDVEITVNLLREIGSQIEWDQEGGVIEIMTKEFKTSYIPQRFCGANRIPILLIGALLGRTGDDIIIPTVGGDAIGKRSVDFHLDALRKLGASVEYREMKKEGAYLAHAHHGLHGNTIVLPYPSVGATENSILASIRARGVTLIKNVAIEPEIVDLILYLQKLGARIAFEAERTIRVEGTTDFKEAEHTVMSDRIEVASFAMAALATGGRVFIEGAQHLHMISFLNQIRSLGGQFHVKPEGIEFFSEGPLRGSINLETDVHPGFHTDWQQPFGVLLTQVEGVSVVHETVYENRFGYTKMLKEMGAQIELFKHCLGGKCCRFVTQNYDHSMIVRGISPLEGREISIPDLRAGFAYVMAALVATGKSLISGMQFLDRGYEKLVPKLQALGAPITRLQTKPDTEPLRQIPLPQTLPNARELKKVAP